MSVVQRSFCIPLSVRSKAVETEDWEGRLWGESRCVIGAKECAQNDWEPKVRVTDGGEGSKLMTWDSSET